MPKSKAKRNRRTQRQKGHRIGNRGYMQAMQELRRSSATSPVAPGDRDADPKHKSARGQHWHDE